MKRHFHAEDEGFGEKYSQVKKTSRYLAFSLEPGSQVGKPGDPLKEPGRLEWESRHSRMERMTYTSASHHGVQELTHHRTHGSAEA